MYHGKQSMQSQFSTIGKVVCEKRTFPVKELLNFASIDRLQYVVLHTVALIIFVCTQICILTLFKVEILNTYSTDEALIDKTFGNIKKYF